MEQFRPTSCYKTSMFERLVASLDFPFLLPSFDILWPPNDACLATSTKTGGESREDIINMRVVITLFSVRKLASTFLPRVWSCAFLWRQEDRSVRNKLHWGRSLGSWRRQSPSHLPKAGGQEMWDFEPIIPPLLAPRRWDVSGTFLSDGERFRPVLRLRLKKNGYNSESP